MGQVIYYQVRWVGGRVHLGGGRVRNLLSTPMGVDYAVIGFDMDVQPLVTHNAA